MGQTHSNTADLEHKLHSITQQMALIIEGGSDDNWVPESLSGVIVQNKRKDGSSVKELYVPQWNVSFFHRGGTIAVRAEPTLLEGKPVRIIVAHSILLHNLLIKSNEYLKAGEIAKIAFATYASDDVKN